MAHGPQGELSPKPKPKVVKKNPVKKKGHQKPEVVRESPAGSVTFTPIQSGNELTVMLSETPPTITDGYSQWEVIDRPRRRGMTRFKGRNPFKQDIGVMFDGWIDDIPQETDISTLMKMTQQPHALEEPPKIILSGQAHKKDLTWVIESIDWDQEGVIWKISGATPVRLRQRATVHLLEYVEDTILITRASPAVTAKGGGTKKKSVGGLTIKQISQQEYGTPDGWQVIVWQNPWLASYGPRKPVPPGGMVQIPQWKGHHAHTIHVGGKK